MTDATMSPTNDDDSRGLGDRLHREWRDFAAWCKEVPGRVVAFRARLRDERDFEKIHGALSKLNKRQLEMLGLKRDDVYSFAELCVYSPDRRPELMLDAPGPVLALPEPSAEEMSAAASEAASTETQTGERTSA
ncbi:MAG: hypothetical protein AAF675_18920 [Pseudomonadota bacterium]